MRLPRVFFEIVQSGVAFLRELFCDAKRVLDRTRKTEGAVSAPSVKEAPEGAPKSLQGKIIFLRRYINATKRIVFPVS